MVFSIVTQLALLILFLFIGNVNGFGCCFFWWVDANDIRQEVLLPLLAMTANVEIIDGIADVSVNQYFITTTDFFLPDTWESKYEIPIDEQASIYAFKAYYLDRVIEGVVKSDEQAKEDFEEALDEGKPAFLGEQADAGLFKVEFGNVPKDVFLTVELSYVAPVQALDRETLRFVIPLTLAPELTPTAIDEVEGLPFENGVVKLNLKACSSAGSVEASSVTHAITVTEEDGCEVVNVTDRELDRRDIVIILVTEKVQTVAVDVYKMPIGDNETTAYMLSILPDTSSFDVDSIKNEFVFIIDRSGSMTGERIEQTALALNETLYILPDDSVFNFIGFGGNFVPLFTESRNITDVAAFGEATTYINTLAANFGGTNLEKPVEYVLEGSPKIGYQRNVFILTINLLLV